MSKHLFGIVVTSYGIAANNRGETQGNITPLQKLLWNGEVHSTISAEAIRWAMRRYWQNCNQKLNRRWNENEPKPRQEWQDRNFKRWKDFIDDDVFGFMSAEAAKEESNEGEKLNNKGNVKGSSKVRRGRLEITRAISLTPYEGDVIFNSAGVGASPSASSTGTDPVPYGTEVHATSFQYGFAITPEELAEKNRIIDVVDAIVSLSGVAGNHARFLFDFSPESIIFRWTDDFAPRILFGFTREIDGIIRIPEIMNRIDEGDIDSHELVFGGQINKILDISYFHKLGVYIGETKEKGNNERVISPAGIKQDS